MVARGFLGGGSKGEGSRDLRMNESTKSDCSKHAQCEVQEKSMRHGLGVWRKEGQKGGRFSGRRADGKGVGKPLPTAGSGMSAPGSGPGGATGGNMGE